MIKDVVKQNPTVSLVVTVLLACIGAFGTWIAADKAATPDALEIMVGENAALRAEYADSLRQNAELQAQLVAVSMRTQAALANAPRQTIRNVLNSLTIQPAWCKEYFPEDDTIRGLHINSAYSFFYKLSPRKFVGSQNVELYGEEIGSIYEENDRQILNDKDSQTFTELVSVNTGAGESRFLVDFVKFHVPVPIERELICGIQIKSIRSVQTEQGLTAFDESQIPQYDYSASASR